MEVKRLHWLMGAVGLCMLLCTPSRIFAQQIPAKRAHQGVLDLRNWSIEADGPLSLDGEWEFYPNRLVPPQVFHGEGIDLQTRFENLPALWEEDTHDSGIPGSFGYATYRLIVQNPPVPDGTKLALSLSNYLSSYELWIDQKLVASNGTVGKDYKETVHQWLPKVVEFEKEGEETELIVQVANYKHRKGGVSDNPVIGTPYQLNRARILDILVHAFLMGSYFLMGAFFLALIVFWKEDTSIMYFAGFCFVFAYRFFAIGPRLNIFLFPEVFTFDLALRLEYLTVYIGVPLIVTYIAESFPRSFSQLALRVFQSVSALCAILVIAMPVRIFTELAVPFTWFMLVFSLYSVFVLIHAARLKEAGSKISLWGFASGSVLLFIACGEYLGWFPGLEYATELSVFVFIVSQAFVIARRFASKIMEQRRLSYETRVHSEEIQNETEVLRQMRKRMAAIKSNLENEVTNRTQKLRNAYSELASVNKELDLFLYRYSHDLRSPLTTLMGLNEVARTSIKEKSAQQLFSHVNLTVVKMDNLVRKLMTLHLINNNQREAPDQLLLEVAVAETLELYEQKIQEEKIRISGNYKKLPLITTNITLLKIVLENVIENSVHYVSQDRKRRRNINIDATLEEKQLFLTVRDNGVGISEESQPLVFDMFFRGSVESPGSGLGLYLAKKSIEKMEGDIEIQSNQHEFTTVKIKIPARSVYPEVPHPFEQE